jgi:hypothetical protein
MKEFYIKNKKTLNIILVIIISFGFLSLAKTCYAWEVIDAAITEVLGWIASLIVAVCGWILSSVIASIIDIAKYNDFINNPQIKDAWVIVRDLCNMFFILILLIIAFATILRIENYNVKKLLPKLLIMAVLINFSRTICGLFIDFSQVIMLTFVNAFADGGGNFMSLLKVEKFLSIAQNTGSWNVDDSINLRSTVAGMIIAVLFMIIATITMIAILIIFVMRVIMLWIYVILSPLAFLLSAFPGGQKYAGQYWGDFTKYLINGPVLAFFIWLALVTMGSLNVNDFAKTFAGGKVEMLQPTNFMHFIIAIGMLVGGLMVSQQIGGIGASWGASAVGNLKTRGWGMAKGAAKLGAFATGRKLDSLQVGAQKKLAGTLGVKDYIPKSLNYRMIAAGWKAKKSKDLEDYESGTGGVNAWRDTFGKYLRIGQYGAVRKSKRRQAEDNEKADKLNKNNRMMNDRVSNFSLSESAKDEKRQSLMKYEKNIINKYNNNGLDGKAEFNKDLASLSTYVPDADSIKDDYKKKIAKNENEIPKLRDEKWFGFKGAKQYGGDYYKSGQTELQEKDERETMSRTDGQGHALITELLQALKTKDQNRTVSTLNILAKNSDINEALKDSRVIDLMAKENGILQDLAKTMKLDQNQTTQLVKDFKNNPVTPAYAQALVQGALKATNMDNALAGRYAHKIGSSSFSAGNGLAFGMTSGNSATGNYEFDKLNFKDGALQTSQSRKDAIIGKFDNLESQAKMRTVHPDVFIKEAQSGDATGLSEEGKDFIKSLTAHDLGQINRLRLDVIRKIGKSKPALRDIKLLAKDLEEQGDQNQADIVKYFAGYIKSKIEGKGELKDRAEAEAAFKEIEV